MQNNNMAKVDDLHLASCLTAKLINYCMISGFHVSKYLYYLLSYYITYSGMHDHPEGGGAHSSQS
jgi:hypothetical protein